MENKARQSIRLRYIAILIAAGLAFFFALRNLFFFDEDIFVTNTKSVFMKEFLQRCTTVKITYLIDNFFWKNNSTGYHITNLLLHLINAILALKVLMQLVSQIDQFNRSVRSDTTLLIFFILFLITPIHSEPLCYILGRDGLLVTTFCLLSILSFLKSQFKSNIYIIASLLFFLLALFSYEVSWTMPLIVIGIISYCCYVKNISFKKHILSAAPYFLIFAVWFVIKIIYLNKGAVTDYNDKALMKTDMLLLIKNNAALFLRNFIPPFENIAIFLSLSSIVFIASLLGFVKLYKVNKQIFALALLLLTVTFLALFPASLFGIDMHDSESERYIYFSSAFALMLLALLITTVIKSKQVLIILVVTLSAGYMYSLFRTASFYNSAGNFSKKYLDIINEKKLNRKYIFILNQPSQYHGALIFRAKSRMNGNSKLSITTINEYLQYLYPGDSVQYVALSTYGLQKGDKINKVLDKPLDSIDNYFPFSKVYLRDTAIITEKGETFPFKESDCMVIALKDSCLYLFK